MDPAQLQQLEALCAQFYSSDPNEQRHAHRTLMPLVQNYQNIPQFVQVLGLSKDPQALLLAANALMKLFTSDWYHVDDGQKNDARAFLLQFLYQKGAALNQTASITVLALIRLLCRVVKLQWLESPSNQNICDQVSQFLQSSTAEWIIGIAIYTELASDMNPQTGHNIARNRRTAFSFRDTALPKIFTTAVETLQKFGSAAIAIQGADEAQLLKQVLQLSLACISFDFMGTIPDETNDERADPVMVPSWAIVREAHLPSLYFEIYKRCCQGAISAVQADCARLCLQNLVQVVALRRSFFNREEDRHNHIREIIKATSEIFQSGMGVNQDGECYHQFCRLLGKLNTSIPPMELKNAMSSLNVSGTSAVEQWSRTSHAVPRIFTPGFGTDRSLVLVAGGDNREWGPNDQPLLDWLAAVAQFTLDGLRKWTYQPNSKRYLMTFWSAMVNPLNSRTLQMPAQIRDHVHEIFKAFVTCCLQIGDATTLIEIQDELNQNDLQRMQPALSFDLKDMKDAISLEDPLEHEVFRTEQLEVIQSVGRVQHIECCEFLAAAWDSTMERAVQGVLPMVLVEKRLTWLIYIQGALVSVNESGPKLLSLRHPESGLSDKDEMDTESRPESPTDVAVRNLAVRVLKLMTGRVAGLDPTRVPEDQVEQRELAYLQFLGADFRRYVFADTLEGQKQDYTATSRKYQEAIGSEDDMMTIILKKILMNIKTLGHWDAVVTKSLNLFRDLATSVLLIGSLTRIAPLVSGHLLLKSPVMQQLLTPQGSREIANSLHGMRAGHHRATYYNVLTRLFFQSVAATKGEELNNNSDISPSESMVSGIGGQPSEQVAFYAFMQPLADTIVQLWPAAGPAGLSDQVAKEQLARDPNDAEQKVALAGLFWDLQGICSALTTAESYSYLFNWLVNRPSKIETSRIHLCCLVLSKMWNDPGISSAALRFAVEFTQNKSQRIYFQSSSPNGIILFREMSAIVTTYGRNLLNQPDSAFRDLYREKYKGLSLCLQLFTNILGGNFANFGAFQVWGDVTLADSVFLGLGMCLAIPEDELQAYVQSLCSYYSFLELVTRNHVDIILRLTSDQIAQLLRTFEDGICSPQSSTIAVQASACLQNLTKYFCVKLAFEDPSKRAQLQDLPKSEEDVEQWATEAARIRQFMAEQPRAFPRSLQLVFQLMMSGEAPGATWGLAGAILGLILLCPQEFQALQQQLVQQQQTPHKQEKLQQCFNNLVRGLEHGVMTQTVKEQFMRNLYTFSQDLKTHLTAPN